MYQLRGEMYQSHVTWHYMTIEKKLRLAYTMSHKMYDNWHGAHIFVTLCHYIIHLPSDVYLIIIRQPKEGPALDSHYVTMLLRMSRDIKDHSSQLHHITMKYTKPCSD